MGCVLSQVDIAGQGLRIKIVKEIAKGGFGEVLLGEDVDGGDKYAIKKILANSDEDEMRIENEAKLHRLFENSETIVQLIAHIQNPPKIENYLIFPFFPHGTIHDELEKRKEKGLYLEEEQILRYFESACRATQEIHSKEYAHRDLKTANFLISMDRRTLVLTDFGSAARVPISIENSKDHNRLIDESAELCSMPYRAPELFSCDIGTQITNSIDIWSLGCCLYAFLYFQSPFDSIYEKGGSIALATQSPHKIEYSGKFSEKLIGLIKSMLVSPPEDRPKIEEILEKTRNLGKELINAVNV
ncbi:unnamed protein product [Caenorhabditis angaria]|uniref:non-specific serine/threonine protein kinase n=1 Tax=Caenorhabditis angaria TaxID=860376 RepID=A0A9P1IFA4_9PELO|nr:unnamed protein product [Caenorhabditis angaria]